MSYGAIFGRTEFGLVVVAGSAVSATGLGRVCAGVPPVGSGVDSDNVGTVQTLLPMRRRERRVLFADRRSVAGCSGCARFVARAVRMFNGLSGVGYTQGNARSKHDTVRCVARVTRCGK